MYTQIIVGTPKCCPNRQCKAVFHRDCHLGWLPKSEIEALVVMRCSKCKDRFAIVQMYSQVFEYFQRLPMNPLKRRPTNPISDKEVRMMRKKLDETQNITTLLEGWEPGHSPRFEE